MSEAPPHDSPRSIIGRWRTVSCSFPDRMKGESTVQEFTATDYVMDLRLGDENRKVRLPVEHAPGEVTIHFRNGGSRKFVYEIAQEGIAHVRSLNGELWKLEPVPRPETLPTSNYGV